MGLRIRKSIKLGAVRLNLNKNSVGMSVGGKLGRVSVNSKGRTTTTIHTPINGVSYVSTHSASSNSSESSMQPIEQPRKEMKLGVAMTILTIFFGWTGIQRFVSGQIGIGLLYLCTLGLFCVGWLYDVIWQIRRLIR